MTDPTAYQTPVDVPVCPRHPDRESHVRCQRCGRPVCPECQRPAAVGVQCVDCVHRAARGGPADPDDLRRADPRGAGRDLHDHGDLRRRLHRRAGQSPRCSSRSRSRRPPASEPCRALTAAFLHSPLVPAHRVQPVRAVADRPVPRGTARAARFVVLYLVCAVGGSAGFVCWRRRADPVAWGTRAVGASGAVFGLFGALLVLNRHLGRSTAGSRRDPHQRGVRLHLPGDRVAGAPRGVRHRGRHGRRPGLLPRRSAPARWGALAAVAVVLLAAVAVRTSTLPPGAELTSSAAASSAAAAPGAAPVTPAGR